MGAVRRRKVRVVSRLDTFVDPRLRALLRLGMPRSFEKSIELRRDDTALVA